MAPQTEPRETILEMTTAIRNAAHTTRETRQSISMIIAMAVTTPFPPLSPKYSGKICPITHAIPAMYAPYCSMTTGGVPGS